MISRCPNVLIAASIAALGWVALPASSKPMTPLAQAQANLAIGAQGETVTELQHSLKLLGYFEGEVNGVYSATTAEAVARFQKATSLPGITRPLAKVSESPKAESPIWTSPWLLGGVGVAGVVGATVLAFARRSRDTAELMDPDRGLLAELPPAPETPLLPEFNSNNTAPPIEEPVGSNGVFAPETKRANEPLVEPKAEPTAQTVAASPKVTETTRLSRINIVDELVQDLRNPDPAKRHKIIWELGQRGDTRAVQPLVDLMVDSDSRQRSLILSALSEIGTRTLKPLTRALAISLQDENAEVRKNAIRDLTRVYDMVTQISGLLHKATDDPDRDVQETAKWALGQLNRIRPTPGMDLPALKNAVSPPESLP